MRKQAHFFVSGKVQGVFYRATAQNTAQGLDLVGWIKNRNDGKVEGVVQGDEKQIRKFLDWAKKGSSAARVEQIEIEWEDVNTKYQDFSIKYH